MVRTHERNKTRKKPQQVKKRDQQLHVANIALALTSHNILLVSPADFFGIIQKLTCVFVCCNESQKSC